VRSDGGGENFKKKIWLACEPGMRASPPPLLLDNSGLSYRLGRFWATMALPELVLARLAESDL